MNQKAEKKRKQEEKRQKMMEEDDAVTKMKRVELKNKNKETRKVKEYMNDKTKRR